MLRQPEHSIFKFPDHPLGSLLPPPFIAEWEFVQALESNTKFFWGKNEEGWLGLEAAGARSHFALSLGAPRSARGRKGGPYDSSPPFSAPGQGGFRTVSSLQNQKYFPSGPGTRDKRRDLATVPLSNRGVSGPGELYRRTAGGEREGGLSRKARPHLLVGGGTGKESREASRSVSHPRAGQRGNRACPRVPWEGERRLPQSPNIPGLPFHLERSRPLRSPAPRGRAPDPALVGGKQQTNPDTEPIQPQPLIART